MDNYQAIAYAQLAMIRQGFTLKQIEKVTGSMKYYFDMYSEEEAEKHADRSMSELVDRYISEQSE
ncbi:hypothetical protein M4D70_26120 [Brevibacillus borstelensis]|uniref:hypothetical protein n=1 Tax=Brevibacillus borstelensis TaxID=45462 RepID=UPI0020415339|nr:hypothetical protein [Brevibacillus borstelensis]MCM3625647.1 hypothetical protein [Brevibacillus borstelensis]